MKKSWLVLLIFVVLFNVSCGQTKKSSTASSNNSLLWEISGNGLTAPSYLFATYYFEGKNFVDSLSLIGEKLKTCKLLVDEAIIDSSIARKMSAAMHLQDNTLDKIFTIEEYDSVKTGVKAFFGQRIDWIDNWKPAALEQYILVAITPKKITKTNPGMQNYLQNEQRKSGGELIGLETMDFNLDLFFNTPMSTQKKHLLFCLRKMDVARKNIDDYQQAYRQQDVERIYNLVMYQDKEFTMAEKDVMVKNRNLKWMEKLPGIIKKQPAFIAVQAFHLAGEFGLINQLRLKGFTVKPVKM